MFIHGDPVRLQQVAWNLLSNAVKFTPEQGSVIVRLETDVKHARVIVSDNGIGISPEDLPQIFERFKQVDGSSTRAYGGLGLGLSIVRHIVEMHGGRVWAESDGKGRGSTFILELPLSNAAQASLARGAE
jgi:signal transduction histidine kinase